MGPKQRSIGVFLLCVVSPCVPQHGQQTVGAAAASGTS